MLAKPVYEKLPTLYLTIGTATILLSDGTTPKLLAILVFMLGAHIFNLRSQNRRSDNPKRRKSGLWPDALYNLLPYGYLLAAIFVFRHASSNTLLLLAGALGCYSLFRLVQRSHYRKHQLPRAIRVI